MLLKSVRRMGYGAMQLAGPKVFGPPKDEKTAIAVLRRAVELGVNHIDTSDFYGPHVTNQILKKALHPFSGITLVTKVGAKRGAGVSAHRGIRPCRARSSRKRCTTIFATWASTSSTS